MPEDYALLRFVPIRGEKRTGAYRLAPYRFEDSQRPNDTIALVPAEKQPWIPQASEGVPDPGAAVDAAR